MVTVERRTLILFVLLMAAAASISLFACARTEPVPEPTLVQAPTLVQTLESDVMGKTAEGLLISRYHDDEKNVTCWVVYDKEKVTSSNGGRGLGIGFGISCLPDIHITHR